jgi:hypothetical protein
MHEMGFASPADHGLCWRRWDFVSGGEVLGGSLRCEELDVEQTHEEKHPNPKNH